MRERDHRRAHRKRMQRFRDDRRADKICRQCPEPAAVDHTGKQLAMCRAHLDADAKRRRDARERNGNG